MLMPFGFFKSTLILRSEVITVIGMGVTFEFFLPAARLRAEDCLCDKAVIAVDVLLR